MLSFILESRFIKKILLLLFLLMAGIIFFFGNAVFAQKGLQKDADKQYYTLRYARAIPLYETLLKKDTGNYEAALHLADSYNRIGDSKNSERVYKRIENKIGGDSLAAYGYAESLSQNGKYGEAQRFMNKYQEVQKLNSPPVNTMNNRTRLYEDSASFKIFYLDINSEQSDFSPEFYHNSIVFASARKKQSGIRSVFSWNNTPFLELYCVDTAQMTKKLFYTEAGVDKDSSKEYSYTKEEQKMHPDATNKTSNDTRTTGYYGHSFYKDTLKERVNNKAVRSFNKKINTKYHEGPVCFNTKQDTMFFTRNNYYKGKYKKSKEGINKLKIYIASKDGASWNNIKEFPWNSNQYSVGHPAYDGSSGRLYFVSDMPGGNGGADLYYSQCKNGSWEKPVNLGTTVNTNENELFPVIGQGSILYFASNRLEGLGGLDLYQVNLNLSSKAENMGFPLNSKKDDFGLIVSTDNNKGYFSSNRKNGGSDDDLYLFSREERLLLTVKVYAQNTSDTLSNVPVKLYEIVSTDTMEIVGEKMPDSYNYKLQKDKKYFVKVIDTLYQASSKVIETSGRKGIIREFLSVQKAIVKDNTPVAVINKPEVVVNCEKYALQNIYYDLDKYAIRREDKEILDKIITIMKQEKDIQLILASHTDSRNTNAYNESLSAKRTESCYDYLTAQGIVAKRLIKENYSEDKLVKDCPDGQDCGEELHQLNRRTEFYIVKGGVNITKECKKRK